MKDNLIIMSLYVACIVMLVLTAVFLLPVVIGASSKLEVRRPGDSTYGSYQLTGTLQDTTNPFNVTTNNLEVK